MTQAKKTKLHRIASELKNSIHLNSHLTPETCEEIAQIALESTNWKSLKAARAYIIRNRLMYVVS